ncbi:DUF1093 domain-containing protein [Enterococcus faecalis]|uniref:DUF1093 domain-containing protein n=1 Tax=Enterococcus faecalis TaxID=1351 RepID=UPI0009B36128|nr:DUF1093 domain-containing protein [Enterococcus faecalis]NSN40921.1 DUF1093 domain-containing protein [Enterococcus faecalis]
MLLLLEIFILGIVEVYLDFNYYNDTYKTSTTYAVVSPENPAKMATEDDNGSTISDSYSYNYMVTFVKENDDRQKIKFDILVKDPKPSTPRAYIKAEVSKKRVSASNQVTENKVPNNVKVEIKINRMMVLSNCFYSKIKILNTIIT